MPHIEETIPKYLQIASHLRDQIVRGDLLPGAEVPSTREIAASYNVAKPTATKALQALKSQGLVEARRGSGTYVREPHSAPRARERYERAAQLGTMYSDSESVSFPFVGVVTAPEHVSTALAIPVGTLAVRRCRIIRSDITGPIEMSISWFPANLLDDAPRLLEPERLRGGTLRYIADVFGIQAVYARDQVCARAATVEESEALGLAAQSPVLAYWLIAYDSADRPVQFDESAYPQERWSFRQEYPITF
jgi:GntR family transcriptional regulator